MKNLEDLQKQFTSHLSSVRETTSIDFQKFRICHILRNEQTSLGTNLRLVLEAYLSSLECRLLKKKCPLQDSELRFYFLYASGSNAPL